jgi:hypothetical protein
LKLGKIEYNELHSLSSPDIHIVDDMVGNLARIEADRTAYNIVECFFKAKTVAPEKAVAL